MDAVKFIVAIFGHFDIVVFMVEGAIGGASLKIYIACLLYTN